ncbi:zinc ribbon domain-containing protein [Gloeocapsopsis dulcis]|nr:zinc ribbon domain-containing protein [Gloeocapsopsis dulcis]WNN92037.1 zinc ribbon domain-containing protein [Gloeocapsopsis dulcis]
MWLNPRSKYCFSCGTQLRERCVSCNEPIKSIKFRFCPYCGNAYKSAK